MSAPLVSVLIPCYNAEPFLGETLESALAQSHPNLEIILVDDGSTDGSIAIARRYEPRIRVIGVQQAGASAARNLATRQSSGEWIQYLDADDLLTPDAIALRLEVALARGAGVVCSDWSRIGVNPSGAWEVQANESGSFTRLGPEPDLAILKGFWAPPAAILYSRGVVEAIGGWHPRLPVIQDARFMMDAALSGAGFAHLAVTTAKYRQHSSHSLSSRSRLGFWTDVLANTLELEEAITRLGRMDAEHKDAFAKAYSLAARLTFPVDRRLYRTNYDQLRRFSPLPESRYMRAARFLESLVGHSLAVRILKVLRPGLHS